MAPLPAVKLAGDFFLPRMLARSDSFPYLCGIKLTKTGKSMIYIVIIAAAWLAWFLWKNRQPSASALPLKECGISIKATHPYGNDYVQLKVECSQSYIRFDIAGANYRGNLDAYLGEFDGWLEPERNNPHDPSAVKVVHSNGKHVGYVPRNYDGDRVKANRQYPCPCRCYLIKTDTGYCGIAVILS